MSRTRIWCNFERFWMSIGSGSVRWSLDASILINCTQIRVCRCLQSTFEEFSLLPTEIFGNFSFLVALWGIFDLKMPRKQFHSILGAAVLSYWPIGSSIVWKISSKPMETLPNLFMQFWRIFWIFFLYFKTPRNQFCIFRGRAMSCWPIH